MVISVFDRVENIMGKGENAGYQHFLLFPIMFSKGFFFKGVKSGLCGKELADNNFKFDETGRKISNLMKMAESSPMG